MCEGILFAGLLGGLLIGVLTTFGFLTMRHPFVNENQKLRKDVEELKQLIRKQ